MVSFSRTKLSLVFLTLFFLLSPLCLAQTIPDIPPAVDPGQELTREQEEQQRLDDLENFESRERESPESEQPTYDPNEGPCINIEQIKVDGATSLGKKVNDIVRPYVPDCMTRGDIASVMKAIDDAYIEKGLITSRAYIEKQDFSDKTLKLRVVEGFVEDVQIVDENGKAEPNQRRYTAFQVLDGELLDLRDFEQGLDQINRLKSAKAKLKLSPGNMPGGTIVNVSVEDKHRFRGFAGWDSFGTPATGENQFRLALLTENLFWANDIWNLNYVGTLDSNALSVSSSIPVGYVTINSSFLASDYLIGLTRTSELYGESRYANFGVNYVFSRTAKTKGFVEFGVEIRRSRRFVNSFELTPQNLAPLRLTVGEIIEGDFGKLSLDGSYIYGSKWLGATKDKVELEDSEPHAQFNAFELGATFIPKPWKWGRLITSVRGSASDVALYGPQQTPLGSRSTVRGFKTAPVSDDIGIYLRNDVIFSLSDKWKAKAENMPNGSFLSISELAKNLQPYIYLDAGAGYSYAQKDTDAVGGYGGGIRTSGKWLKVDIGVEAPIAKREFREFNDPRFFASVGLNWP